MVQILFLYSTVDGHTLEICQRLQGVVERGGHTASLLPLTADAGPGADGFDAIVIGASIRYGKHRPDVGQFIERNLDSLEAKPSAFFSVNAVARKPLKREPHSNPYVKKFLNSISWQPAVIGIFGGQIDYPSYRFFDKTMIRFIMWMTGGPTDPNGTFDFTDWDAVDAFGRRISELASDGR
jgi:menaquinone-dependent protoporphyrinogen oxidase